MKLQNKTTNLFHILTGMAASVILFTPLAGKPADADKRLKIVQAASLEQTRIDGEDVQQFLGDVVFSRGSMFLYTDKAVHYIKRNEFHLLGSVRLVDELDTLLSRSMIFYSDSISYLKAIDDIYFRQDDRVISCDSLLYWTDADSGIAMGDVKMVTPTDTMTTTVFEYWETEGYRGISFNARGYTEIHDKTRTLIADEMSYDDNKQLMTLNGNCDLIEPERGISGNLILVQYADSLISSVFVEGNTSSYQELSAALTPYNRQKHKFRDTMTSGMMQANFEDGLLSELKLMGMAITEYNVVKDDLLNGVNTVSGDTIAVTFREGDILRIQVFGGGRGYFVPEGNNTTVDSTVTYQAEYLDYHVDEQLTFLEADASVHYQGTRLSAGYIMSDWKTDILKAEKRGDVFPTISSPTSEPMSGEFMEFNLITKHGRVVQGKTRLNRGYYYGQEVFRDDPNIIHVNSSMYTTCDLEKPHFHFSSKKMKMITGDRVIAKPIILFIYDIPVFGIPLAIFPNKGGDRRSGWVMPNFGYRASAGNYMEGLGYYWAPNDYIDGKLLLNFRDIQGFDLRGRLRYVKRYQFDGNLSTEYYRDLLSDDIADIFSSGFTNRWKVSWAHNQTIDPTQRLNIQAYYVSNNRINQEYGWDYNTQLQQKITSRANYSKNWPSSKNSLSVTMLEDYDLLAVENTPLQKSVLPGNTLVERTRLLPGINFNHSQSQIFGNGPRWYNAIYWSLSTRLDSRQFVELTAATDSTWLPDRTYRREHSVKHNISLTAPGKYFGWLNLNPGLSLKEDWVFKYRRAFLNEDGTFMKENDAIVYEDVNRFKARHTGSLSLSANTKIYGTFPMRIGRLDALRHVITPTVTYSWQPDYSQKIFGVDPGYFQKDANGELFDQFSGTTAGATSSRESQSLSFSINNDFQYKWLTSDQTYSKKTFLTWNMSSGYKPTADSLKFDPVRSFVTVRIPGGFELDLTMTHNLYDLELNPATGKLVTVDRFASFPRLLSISTGTAFRLSGKKFLSSDIAAATPDTIRTGSDDLLDVPLDVAIEGEPPIIDGRNLWEASVTFRYALNRLVEDDRLKDNITYWVRTNLKVNLTKDWIMQYNATFDLDKNELTSHSFSFTRPLHCWEFSFQWRPSGGNKGFRLRISVKENDLKDVKLTSRGGKLLRYYNP